VRARVAHVQSALTVGQVFGPLVGAVTAVQLGFRSSFLVGGAILFGCAWLVYRGAPAPPARPTTTARGAPTNWRDVAHVAGIVLGGSIQVMFLPAIMPEILPALGVPPERTIEVAGLLIFVSGVAAALGALLATRLPDVFPESRLIPALLALSSLLLVAFGFAGSVWMLGALRFLQVLCVAPVFPMVIARIAHRAGGEAIGFINGGRIAAAFIGPVAATTVLAWAPAPVLYAALGVVGFACVPLAWRGERERWATT
jgi:MFS transporter, DHA1 family, multidrug resistance protein